MYEALGLKVPFQWYNVQQMPQYCHWPLDPSTWRQSNHVLYGSHEQLSKVFVCYSGALRGCSGAQFFSNSRPFGKRSWTKAEWLHWFRCRPLRTCPWSWLRTSALNSSRFFQKLTSLVKPLDFLDCPEHPWAQDRTKLSKRHGAVSVGELEPRAWSRNELHFFQVSFLFGHCFRGIESSHGSESLCALEVSESWILGIWHGRVLIWSPFEWFFPLLMLLESIVFPWHIATPEVLTSNEEVVCYVVSGRCGAAWWNCWAMLEKDGRVLFVGGPYEGDGWAFVGGCRYFFS